MQSAIDLEKSLMGNKRFFDTPRRQSSENASCVRELISRTEAAATYPSLSVSARFKRSVTRAEETDEAVTRYVRS